MNVLLDTHTLLWFLEGDTNLTTAALSRIENENSVKYVSIASIWEIAIKLSLNKFEIKNRFEHFY